MLSYTDVHILIVHILLRVFFLRSIMYILLHTSMLRAYSITLVYMAPILLCTYFRVYSTMYSSSLLASVVV